MKNYDFISPEMLMVILIIVMMFIAFIFGFK